MKKQFSKIKIISLVCFMLISLIPSYLAYATSEENVIANFNQTYIEESNTVNVEVTTEVKEGFEVTAIQKQEEEKIQGTENVYIIDKNDDYTFTIYYKEISELEEKIEEKREYTVSVDKVKDQSTIKEENINDVKDDIASDKVVEPATINTKNARYVTTSESAFVLDQASGIELKYTFRSDGTAAVYKNNTSGYSNIKKPEGFSGVFHIP